MRARAPIRSRSDSEPEAWTSPQSHMPSARVRLVQLDEVSECDRESFDGIEGIVAESVFQAGNDQGETQGIQASMEKLEIIRQRNQLAVLLACNIREQVFYGLSHRHFALHLRPRLQDCIGHANVPAPHPCAASNCSLQHGKVSLTQAFSAF